MTDRELLEMAAKAAGITGQFENDGKNAGFHLYNPDTPCVWKRWHPLKDDGDALRLAVKLGLYVCTAGGSARIRPPFGDDTVEFYDAYKDDGLAATRRAIVRAAAAISAQEAAAASE